MTVMKKQVIWLVMDEYGVDRMTKRMPASLGKAEHAVKAEIEWDPRALRPPVLETRITIQDWRQGLDVGDIEFRQLTLTATEAEGIRQRRREAMVEQMRELGYTVTPPDQENLG
jgi:hypothetical protein